MDHWHDLVKQQSKHERAHCGMFHFRILDLDATGKKFFSSLCYFRQVTPPPPGNVTEFFLQCMLVLETALNSRSRLSSAGDKLDLNGGGGYSLV